MGAIIRAASPADDARDLSVGHLAELARTYGILILRGFRPLDKADVDSYARRWGGHAECALRYDAGDLIIEAKP
jgi:alpha-ketoglutarate-dependent taurine dioxygenase